MNRPHADPAAVAAIHARKEAGRHALARLPMGEKLVILDAMREQAALIQAAGARRRAALAAQRNAQALPRGA